MKLLGPRLSNANSNLTMATGEEALFKTPCKLSKRSVLHSEGRWLKPYFEGLGPNTQVHACMRYTYT